MTDTSTPTDIARDVLTIERDALDLMRDTLPETFDTVVDRLLKVPGRVIVSGMGKSGHVAAKIAATFASTGTPAQYVHPGEASHGDLGMVTGQDAVILISNSGETRELADITAHCARYSIPLVAITKKPGSALARQADHVLTLPDAPEACGIGMAPTTSTTCTMAMGDALAVAMMKLRGFERENFLAFHPGGTLGAQLLKVSAVMHTGDELPLVTEDTPMGETLVEMTRKSFGVAAVVSGDQLVGIVTDGDLRRNMDGLMTHTAGEVATKSPLVTAPDTLLVEALGVMNSNKRTVLLVTDSNNRLVGLVHIHDALRAGVA
ncbi:Arabinose 5-phosphate isomerase KdsD [Roseovarius sp. THAF27]|uniref:KpsF/GutQ family sugar-phosphate isomerase n=1 Tax=unclassified Roseovarius TaxID=2614913 RepID=UPI00126963A3|nr:MULTISPECIES: KpsF/GutQ family sugar-phosphate isomerase [unclassified Roseovarius]QFT79502.1 Arabinose 5-phosphate isomerase KdsD [Roseovarius sp. THAF27]QFT97328.1 Arabinose 5-phosphate isomerase KdsD [Roseovarius sp. THAF8]